MVGAYEAVVATIDVDAPAATADVLAAFFAALLAGIVLYFIDFPSKGATYRYLLPDAIVRRWNVEMPAGRRPETLYFLILDEALPAGLRNRALYYGSIFRIGYEVVYILFSTGFVVVALCYLDVASSHARYDNSTTKNVVGVASGILLALALWGPVIGPLIGRLSGRAGRFRAAATELRSQVRWLDRAVLSAALVSAFVAWNGTPVIPAGVLIAAPGAAAALWAVRYHRGVRPADLAVSAWHVRERLTRRAPVRNLSATPATFLLAIAAGTLLVVTAAGLPEKTVLSPAAAGGWAAGMTLSAVLVYLRGHERSMMGSRGEVIVWLELHRAELLDRYDPAARDVAGGPPASRGLERRRFAALLSGCAVARALLRRLGGH
jgi:hypothetical protein